MLPLTPPPPRSSLFVEQRAFRRRSREQRRRPCRRAPSSGPAGLEGAAAVRYRCRRRAARAEIRRRAGPGRAGGEAWKIANGANRLVFFSTINVARAFFPKGLCSSRRFKKKSRTLSGSNPRRRHHASKSRLNRLRARSTPEPPPWLSRHEISGHLAYWKGVKNAARGRGEHSSFFKEKNKKRQCRAPAAPRLPPRAWEASSSSARRLHCSRRSVREKNTS